MAGLDDHFIIPFDDVVEVWNDRELGTALHRSLQTICIELAAYRAQSGSRECKALLESKRLPSTKFVQTSRMTGAIE